MLQNEIKWAVNEDINIQVSRKQIPIAWNSGLRLNSCHDEVQIGMSLLLQTSCDWRLLTYQLDETQFFLSETFLERSLPQCFLDKTVSNMHRSRQV